VSKVRVPGRGSLARRRQAQETGAIDVDKAVYETLVSLRNGPVGTLRK
jgi:LDH2 family malate/lactate/ureidoglycolate dehydrogenase